MARMLGKSKEPKLCPYGCCRSWKYYSRKGRDRVRVRRELRLSEARAWRKVEFKDLDHGA